jgi:DNA (cytosine-5)-methyltransferase 1
MSLIYADVCSGISAATVAWKPLGWRCAFYSEVEKFPCAVLRHHYPDTPNLGDMTAYEEWPDADIDVLVGGTPCQGFSIAGLRAGLDDPRSNLALCVRCRTPWRLAPCRSGFI